MKEIMIIKFQTFNYILKYSTGFTLLVMLFFYGGCKKDQGLGQSHSPIRFIGRDGNTQASYLMKGDNNSVLIFGVYSKNGNGVQRLYLAKMDQDLNLLWDTVFGSELGNTYSVVPVYDPDSNIVIAANEYSSFMNPQGFATQFVRVYKFNRQGNILRTQILPEEPHPFFFEARALKPNADRTYSVIFYNSFTIQANWTLFYKLNNDLTILSGIADSSVVDPFGSITGLDNSNNFLILRKSTLTKSIIFIDKYDAVSARFKGTKTIDLLPYLTDTSVDITPRGISLIDDKIRIRLALSVYDSVYAYSYIKSVNALVLNPDYSVNNYYQLPYVGYTGSYHVEKGQIVYFSASTLCFIDAINGNQISKAKLDLPINYLQGIFENNNGMVIGWQNAPLNGNLYNSICLYKINKEGHLIE